MIEIALLFLINDNDDIKIYGSVFTKFDSLYQKEISQLLIKGDEEVFFVFDLQRYEY